MHDLRPLVSVVIPTYNRVDLVNKAIDSVLDQTYKSLECIVVDDCSMDGTMDFLVDMALEDERIRLVSHVENMHLSAARNTGVLAAEGEYIAFLDDDDIWLPYKIERQVALFAQAPKTVGMVYCWMDVYKGESLIGYRHPVLRGNIFDDVLVTQPLGNGSTFMVRRCVFDSVGFFDEGIKRGVDGDFVRRVAKTYNVEVVPEVLVHYHVDHGGFARITGTNKGSIEEDIISQELKLVKFRDDLKRRPLQHSKILIILFKRYLFVGDFGCAINAFLMSVKVSPFSIFSVLKEALMIILKCFLKRFNFPRFYV